MANLTITLDDEILNRARIRARAEGASVDDVVRKFLEVYAGASTAEQAAATRDLIELSLQTSSHQLGKRWLREELYGRE
jgi:plasmid stability protein